MLLFCISTLIRIIGFMCACLLCCLAKASVVKNAAVAVPSTRAYDKLNKNQKY